MELAIIYTLQPPTDFDNDVPIQYKCGECDTVIMGYNVEGHTRNYHQAEHYVLKNVVPFTVDEVKDPVEDQGNV